MGDLQLWPSLAAVKSTTRWQISAFPLVGSRSFEFSNCNCEPMLIAIV